MLRATPALALLAGMVGLLTGCGGTDADALLTAARGHLEAGDYTEATDAATRGLAAGAEGATAWRLELVALEGEARGGRTDAALARLERVAEAWPEQVRGALYVQTASQVKEGGDAAGAISVLDAGAKRFPDDEDIVLMIEEAKTSGGDAELERLRSLGYVE
jgi:predicted Zn-dependent protease